MRQTRSAGDRAVMRCDAMAAIPLHTDVRAVSRRMFVTCPELILHIPKPDGIVMWWKNILRKVRQVRYNYCTEKNKHRGKAHATCYGRYMVVVSLRACSSVKGRTYRPRFGSWSIKDNEENKVWYSIFLIMIGRSWQLNLFPSIFFYDIDQFRVRIGGPGNEMRIWNSVHGISEPFQHNFQKYY